MTEPTTQAGKRLVARLRHTAAWPHILLRDLPVDWLHADIGAIEQESAEANGLTIFDPQQIEKLQRDAVQQERERIAEGVAELENLESRKRYLHGYPPNWPFVVIRRDDVLNVIFEKI